MVSCLWGRAQTEPCCCGMCCGLYSVLQLPRIGISLSGSHSSGQLYRDFSNFPCYSVLLSYVCCLLLLGCLVIVAKVINIVTFHGDFCIFFAVMRSYFSHNLVWKGHKLPALWLDIISYILLSKVSTLLILCNLEFLNSQYYKIMK